MSGGLASAEVAEDYKNSLEDLTVNSRYEINNLTVIAKENTEHAMAISRTIEHHIRVTPPDRKLPALYVLDSVVKNVGTPYTLFLGRNLYKTFMEAYAAVGSTQVRRKLDEMLKTWKDPVPGSVDTRPVFPAEVTRKIESDLIRWRTSDLQRQQEQARNQQHMVRPIHPSATPWRNTPTPPQHLNRQQQPLVQGYSSQPSGVIQNRSPYPMYPLSTPQPTPVQYPQTYQPVQVQQYQQQTSYPPHPQPPSNLDSLHKDINNLISTTKSEFLADVNNLGLRDKLKALLDLQSILSNQRIAPHELEAVRHKIAELSAPPAPPAPSPYPPPVLSTPVPFTNGMNASQQVAPESHTHISVPPVPPPTHNHHPDISIMNSTRLADILAKAQQGPGTAVTTSSTAPYTAPPVVPLPASTSRGEPSSLLAQLRAAGILGPEGGTPVNGSVPTPPLRYIPPQVSGQTPTSQLAPPPRIAIDNDVELTSSSLKKPRPHLIAALYDSFPSQCSTCGKRFVATPEGKKRKEKHLDWHFRIRIKREDAARRGQSRSWYVSELEWIKWKETSEEGDDGVSNGANVPQSQGSSAAEVAPNDPKNQYILVPGDHSLANLPCPICQEPFEQTYDSSISDWVWRDAVKVGSRVYHASEYADMKKEGGSLPLRTATPDSVLGKRKATEDDTSATRTKVLRAVEAPTS